MSDHRALGHHDLHLWSLQMHVMLGAGMPLLGALELIAHSEHPRLSVASDLVAERISGGWRMSQAMKAIEPTFSPFVINLVAVGEQSGRLVQVFERIADRSFRRDKTERAVRGALAYPAFLASVSVAMACFMAFYMFPRLLPFLEGLRVELPWPTRLLMWGTNHLSSFLVAFLVVAVWVGTLLALSRNAHVVRAREWLTYSTPLFGKINRDRVYADCLNDLHMLLEAQCDLIGSLKTLRPPWEQQRECLRACVKLIQNGATLTQAVEQSEMLPRFYLAPVKSAEETGRLSSTFRLLADSLDESVAMELDRLVQLLEPLILATMGVVTGFVVLATFLPLYSMASTAL